MYNQKNYNIFYLIHLVGLEFGINTDDSLSNECLPSFELFHQETDKFKTIFENNGYPKSLVDLRIKKYLDKVVI